MNRFLFALFALTSVVSVSADQPLVEQIRAQATHIASIVGTTGVSSAELERVLDLLDQADHILHGAGPAQSPLMCEPYSSGYAYVIRRSDSQRLGDYTSLANCQQIVRGVYHGKVCAPYSSGYAYVTEIATGQRIGDYLSVPACLELIPNQKNNLFCQPYSSGYAYVIRSSDKQRLGDYTSAQNCGRAVKGSTPEFFCRPYSSGYAYITRTATNQTVGNYLSFDSCLQSLP